MCGSGDTFGVKLGTDPVGMNSSERGKRLGVALLGRRPVGGRAGATPAVDAGSWRSRRSTPRPESRPHGEGRQRDKQHEGDGKVDAEWRRSVAGPHRGKSAGTRRQQKLHRWAFSEPDRRFDDVFNLVCDKATLVVAWERVAHNAGASTAGVDAVTRHAVERRGVSVFLEELRCALKTGRYRPLPVRQTTIPKKGGKVRYLGYQRCATVWHRWRSSS